MSKSTTPQFATAEVADNVVVIRLPIGQPRDSRMSTVITAAPGGLSVPVTLNGRTYAARITASVFVPFRAQLTERPELAKLIDM